MTGFAQTFLGKELSEVKTFFSAEFHDFFEILAPLAASLEKDAETIGVAGVKRAFVAAAAAAMAAKSAGSTPSQAGNAAIAAAETSAVATLAELGKAALADGEAALSGSGAHTLATAAVAA